MRIVWITNVPTPIIARDVGLTNTNSGGWLYWLSERLSTDHELTMMFPTKKWDINGRANNISYYGLPSIKNESDLKDNRYSEYCKNILKIINPDIIHIWGTEYLHSTLIFNCAKDLHIEDKVIISIQGLVSVCANHYWAFIDDKTMKIPTLKDIIRKTGVAYEYKDFIYRGQYEEKLIKSVNRFIGRTDWDHACITLLNSNAKYYKCNEIMRDAFYDNSWSLDLCNNHTLFISQGMYPIKGLHLALKAVELLKDRYPDVQLRVAGKKPIDTSFHGYIRESRYDRYIRKLVHKYGLENNVKFLGRLDEQQMCDEYIHAHVFVSPSSIENSSNSVAEAMLLGVPIISSDVGGIKTFIKHGKNGLLYQADAPYMLADCISQYFDDSKYCQEVSENAIVDARKFYSKEQNYSDMLNIYTDIAKG